MALMDLPMGERLQVLQDLLTCTWEINAWCYDSQGKLLGTNCPDRVLDKVFAATGCMEKVLDHARTHRKPVLLSNYYGLCWSAAFEFSKDALKRIHVFGPISTSELNRGDISEAVQGEKIPGHWRPKLIKVLQRIPVISTVDFLHQTLMLHYCVTGEQSTIADITFLDLAGRHGEKEAVVKKDRMNTYRMEQALMHMIRTGDLNYKSVLHEASFVSQGVQAGKIGSMEQMRASQIVFISLCTRAAIQGGVTPEVAYSRGDAYIQDILECRTVSDAAYIGHTMYEDFIRLVHQCRANPGFSEQIRNCCDYIELHAEEKLTIAEIASYVGYADYYLSRKFKSETGIGINDYIKMVKVEKAKMLLLSTNLSIQEICDRLNFGSRSFFAETFKEITGITPAAFRRQSIE